MSQRHQKSLHQNPTRPHPRVKTNFDFFYRLPNMAVRISPGRVAPAFLLSYSRILAERYHVHARGGCNTLVVPSQGSSNMPAPS